MAKNDFIVSGLRVQRDSKLTGDKLIAKFESYGTDFKFFILRLDCAKFDEEDIYNFAQYFRDNEIYFVTHGSYQNPPEGTKHILTKKIAEKMQSIAGEYYLGDTVSEFGSFYATKAKGYRRNPKPNCLKSDIYMNNPVPNLEDVKMAKDAYIREIKKIMNRCYGVGIKKICSLQSVTFLNYDFEAGADFGLVELAGKNDEKILSFARGASRAFEKEILGGFLAHWCYGGFDNLDTLKAKRLKLEYLTLYMSGINIVCLENGHEGFALDGYTEENRLQHPATENYLKNAKDFDDFIKSDIRPSNGPITRIAFVQGNLDGFACGRSSSLWGQYEKEEWGVSNPEYTYHIFDDVYRSCDWNDIYNYGDYDLSNSPAYGMYDVIPATAPLHIMKNYDWLIFTGWNTMTKEIYENLKAFVKAGGRLLISAAHIRTSVSRTTEGDFLDADWEEFLGCELTNEKIRTNDGFKFKKESTIDKITYPGYSSFVIDPNYSAGYTDYIKVNPIRCEVTAYVADSNSADFEHWFPFLIENKYGEGTVMFMTNSDYPGASQIMPIYKMLVKIILTHSHRNCDIKVVCSDRVRFSVFEDDTKYKIYILNTDFDLTQQVKVIYKDSVVEKIVDPVGLEIVELLK